MAMPKAAMNEDHLLPKRKYDIRPSWQRSVVQPISIPHRIEHPPDTQLWSRVLSLDRSHVPATLRPAVYVNHIPESGGHKPTQIERFGLMEI
jgi:hypothetical protein